MYGPQTLADGTTNRRTIYIFPTDKDLEKQKDKQSQLLPVKDAYILLSDYVGCLVELIVNNRQRGRFLRGS